VRFGETLTRHRTIITLIAIIIGCLVSLGISTDSMRLRPKEVGQSVVGVFQQAVSAVGGFFSQTVTSVRELRNLRAQYDGVVDQLREYEQVAGDISSLREENGRLRRVLDFSNSIQIENMPARVIAKEPGSFFSGLTINRGRASGIRRDMPVISNQDGVQGLVGRVSEVGLSSSVVMPIFDPQSFVAARLQRSRHEGLVGGQGAANNLLSMGYVAKNARSQISTGDLVITSGMRSIYPEGIRIGMVDAIRGEAYETSLQIEVIPIVDFGRLEYVFVLGASQ
jgi:rod shape-determining protein MreC